VLSEAQKQFKSRSPSRVEAAGPPRPGVRDYARKVLSVYIHFYLFIPSRLLKNSRIS
jgi:hypothetical protein